jgi:hypothetical protein
VPTASSLGLSARGRGAPAVANAALPPARHVRRVPGLTHLVARARPAASSSPTACHSARRRTRRHPSSLPSPSTPAPSRTSSARGCPPTRPSSTSAPSQPPRPKPPQMSCLTTRWPISHAFPCTRRIKENRQQSAPDVLSGTPDIPPDGSIACTGQWTEE